MTRQFHHISCGSDRLAATVDGGDATTGLLIVSGGNEIRSGAHGGMAHLATIITGQNFPVLRYDRRGIGDSSGQNGSFLESAEDLAAAAGFFRRQCPQVEKIVGFGNCDAATVLALFGPDAGIDAFLLANPWVIEAADEPEGDQPNISSAAIRSRYWDRLKNPRTLVDLISGKIDIGKLLHGLKRAVRSEENSALSIRLRDALPAIAENAVILLAQRDTTARAFLAAWNSPDFKSLRQHSGTRIETLDSASHSFADAEAQAWLTEKILDKLRTD